MDLLTQLARQMAAMDLGALGGPGGTLFIGQMPAAPVDAVALYARDLRTPGDDAGAVVQVLVRGDGGETAALTLAGRIAAALDGFCGYLCGDGFWADVRLLSGPADIGAGRTGHHEYAISFRVYYCE